MEDANPYEIDSYEITKEIKNKTPNTGVFSDKLNGRFARFNFCLQEI